MLTVSRMYSQNLTLRTCDCRILTFHRSFWLLLHLWQWLRNSVSQEETRQKFSFMLWKTLIEAYMQNNKTIRRPKSSAINPLWLCGVKMPLKDSWRLMRVPGCEMRTLFQFLSQTRPLSQSTAWIFSSQPCCCRFTSKLGSQLSTSAAPPYPLIKVKINLEFIFTSNNVLRNQEDFVYCTS